MISNSRLTKIMGAILAALFLVAQAAVGGTYSCADVPQDIPDPGALEVAIDVPDLSTITGISAEIQILHSFDGDLSATLESPSGTQVVLFSKVGGDGDNFKNTIFDDEAKTAIADGTPPFEGAYQPQEKLSAFNGETSQGTWKLIVTDDSKLDAGSLVWWSLVIEGNNGPVAKCQDVSLPAEKGLQADVTAVDIDNGSYDPDDDPITLSLDPEGPYPIGQTEVTLTVTDDSDVSATCTATVTVVATAYSNIEEAIAVLGGVVDPDDPNDPVQMAIDELTLSLGNGVLWAGPYRIADGQGGENGADVFVHGQAALDLLDASDPNQAQAIALVVAADKILVDTVISDAAFQGADVTEAKELRNEGMLADAWASAAGSLKVPPVKVEEVPTLDYNQDGVVNVDDLFAFADDILAVLVPEPEPAE
jgi:subtilisin-like proprotein convertase family protein